MTTNALSWEGSYDYNGNITASQGTITYGYDQENRLAAVTNSSTWATTFVYDGLGRLRKRQEYYWLGSGWETANLTNYVYDGNLVLQMRENSTPVETFTRGSDLSGQRGSALNGGLPRESGTSLSGAGGIGGLLARTTGYSSGSWSTHDYYHADGNGNITYLELTNQTVAASYVYDPYGNVLSSSGTVAAANLYRFSSKELHEASGMYYYGYRFYIPEYQRWINRDQVNERGFRVAVGQKGRLISDAEINPYYFVRNHAMDAVDSLGLFEFFYWPPYIDGTNCRDDEIKDCQKACFDRGMVLKRCHADTWTTVEEYFNNGVEVYEKDIVWRQPFCDCVNPRSCPPPNTGSYRNGPSLFP